MSDDKEIIVAAGNTKEEMMERSVLKIGWMVFDSLGGAKGMAQYYADKNHPERRLHFDKMFFAPQVPKAIELSGSGDKERPINIYIPVEAKDL
ncbi:hypothetical protein AGMMS49593_02230 [Endomicrobiia bacterium]|nr:hypothetical protein AGMMS49593_02230 [Endomicrobiia bacterium]